MAGKGDGRRPTDKKHAMDCDTHGHAMLGRACFRCGARVDPAALRGGIGSAEVMAFPKAMRDECAAAVARYEQSELAEFLAHRRAMDADREAARDEEAPCVDDASGKCTVHEGCYVSAPAFQLTPPPPAPPKPHHATRQLRGPDGRFIQAHPDCDQQRCPRASCTRTLDDAPCYRCAPDPQQLSLPVESPAPARKVQVIFVNGADAKLIH